MTEPRGADAADAVRARLAQRVAGRRVLVMLSGGKDSALCLALLAGCGARVEAIHFRHAWGWALSTSEARRIAAELGVPLTEIDYSAEFRRRVLGTTDGRPCKICKIGMYRVALERAAAGGVDLLCTGDNASDTVVERVRRHQRDHGEDPAELMLTAYLDCESEGVALPAGLRVLRPVISLAADEVARALERRGVVVARNHETGDKYFEYWREGCPMQYREPGEPVTEADLDRLLAVNQVATALARAGGFRAAVHLPSGRVVTVPAGREPEVVAALRAAGHDISAAASGLHDALDPSPVARARPPLDPLVVEVFGLDARLLATVAAALPLVERFLERWQLTVLGRSLHDLAPSGATLVFALAGGHLAAHTFPALGTLRLDFLGRRLEPRSRLEHILFEIFKTRDWEIR